MCLMSHDSDVDAWHVVLEEPVEGPQRRAPWGDATPPCRGCQPDIADATGLRLGERTTGYRRLTLRIPPRIHELLERLARDEHLTQKTCDSRNPS